MFLKKLKTGQKVISVQWVITQKFKDNEIICKACLVAGGFEKENLKDIRKDSPTCCKDNSYLVTCITAFNQSKIHVCVQLPKEAETAKL